MSASWIPVSSRNLALDGDEGIGAGVGVASRFTLERIANDVVTANIDIDALAFIE